MNYTHLKMPILNYQPWQVGKMKMKNHSFKLILIQMQITICLSAIGCRSANPNGEAIVKTKNILSSVCLLVQLGEDNAKEEPPIKLPDLVIWIKNNVSDDESYINYTDKTIKDTWGNKIVILSHDGKFIGVASAGPNGIWENNSGDDITLTMDEFKRRKSSTL